MTLDIQASLLTYLFNLLTTDSTLQSNMGGTVRLYPVWAEPDAEFPYLVHRIDMRDNGYNYVLRRGTYYLDIWSYSENANEILAIRKRIITLLDELNFNTDEVGLAHVELQTDGFVSESSNEIWHYVTQWNLIFRRDAEVTAIESR